MGQKWIQILVIMAFYQRITAGPVTTVRKGAQVEITCEAKPRGNMVIWFRALDTSTMEFIASFSTNGIKKSSNSNFLNIFDDSKMTRNILTLKSFDASTDSGVYICASLYKGNELQFGNVTRLRGEKTKVPTEAPRIHTTKENLSVTPAPCNCKDQRNRAEAAPLPLFCTPIILGPLAGGCGLLLLILLFTILYCNQMRTRRCPHHHKRKPQMQDPEKLKMTSRHV
ncbi:T-cell surface glycoprotein CD8 alpha chain isoform X1 [Brachyistius frenatus]|uniref:T-cell surface glycoprotein CD8 alpha chain isoform X1 n=1 Tax=Brachyistius frenatus TaxID=100188 RepID=UPI0037E87CC8